WRCVPRASVAAEYIELDGIRVMGAPLARCRVVKCELRFLTGIQWHQDDLDYANLTGLDARLRDEDVAVLGKPELAVVSERSAVTLHPRPIVKTCRLLQAGKVLGQRAES